MSAIVWDDTGERLFELGIDRGVLYVDNQPGVPWNGLSEIEEKPTGGSATPYYLDGEKYLNVPSSEEFAGTITAYTYPDEFLPCDGTQQADIGLFVASQPRVPFNLTYRTLVGNDTSGTSYAYKIHLIYNALAEPSTRDNKTLSSSAADPTEFAWDISVSPIQLPGYKSSGHLIFDTEVAHPGAVVQLEQLLYGTDTTDPAFPAFSDILAIIAENANIMVVDNGDGTYTLTADDDALTISGGTFTVESNAVTDNGNGTFTISTI
jgi:hypothetical protein